MKQRALYATAPLAASALMMSASGSVYLVATYSSTLGTLLGLTTGEIATLSTVITAGAWFSIIPGLFLDRYGPKPTALIGTAMILVGYICMSLAAKSVLHLSFPGICFIGFLYGHGSAWTNVAALVTATANTSPKSRGAVIGLLQANFGLASGYYTEIFETFGLSVPQFLLSCGIIMATCMLLAWPSNHLLTRRTTTDLALLYPVGAVTAIGAALILVSAATQSRVASAAVALTYAGFACGVACLSVAMLHTYGISRCAALWPRAAFDAVEADQGWTFMAKHSHAPDETSTFLARIDDDDDVVDSSASGVGNGDEEDDGGSTLQHAVMLPQFWALLVVFGVGVGSGITVLDNTAFLVDALSTSAEAASSTAAEASKANTVALFSACNTAGRIAIGLASDAFVTFMAVDMATAAEQQAQDQPAVVGRRRRLPRAYLLGLNLLLMAAAMMAMAYSSLKTLPYAVALTAVTYGGMWVLVPSSLADLFGGAHFGAINGFATLAPTLGTELLYNLMSTRVYAREANKSGAEEDGSATTTCYDDPDCFKPTFILLSWFCGAAAIVAMWTAAASGHARN